PPYQETLQIEPNSTQTFTFTFQGTQSFYIEGYLQDIGIREYVIVEESRLDISLLSESLVGKGTNTLRIRLKNPTLRPLHLFCRLTGDYEYLLNPGNEAIIQEAFSITNDATFTLTITGDYVAIITFYIVFGEKVNVELKPDAVYKEGWVEIPFTIENNGSLSSTFELEFSLLKDGKLSTATGYITIKTKNLKRKTQNANKENKIEVYIKPNEKIEGILHYEGITIGEYKIGSSFFREKVQIPLNVAKENTARIGDIFLDEQEKTLCVEVENTGVNGFLGQLSIVSSFISTSTEISIEKLATSTIKIPILPFEGTHIINASILYLGNKVDEKEEEFSFSPRFEIEKATYTQLNIGGFGTITFVINNRGWTSGKKDIFFSFLEFSEKRGVFLERGSSCTLEFAFFIDDDLAAGTYTGYLRIDELHSFPLYLKGWEIGVETSLDRKWYNEGDIATLTITINNKNGLTGSLSTIFRLAGEEKIDEFELASKGSHSSIFSFHPLFDKKIFFGIYTKTGRGLWLDSVYLRKQEDVAIRLLKDVFAPGELVLMEIEGEGSLTLFTPGSPPYFHFNHLLKGTASFFLPPNMKSGTYYITWESNTKSGKLPFDVKGYEVVMLGIEMDKGSYIQDEGFVANVRLLPSYPGSYSISYWLKDTMNGFSLLGKDIVFLEMREIAYPIKGFFSSGYSGRHSLVVGVFKDDELLGISEEDFFLSFPDLTGFRIFIPDEWVEDIPVDVRIRGIRKEDPVSFFGMVSLSGEGFSVLSLRNIGNYITDSLSFTQGTHTLSASDGYFKGTKTIIVYPKIENFLFGSLSLSLKNAEGYVKVKIGDFANYPKENYLGAIYELSPIPLDLKASFTLTFSFDATGFVPESIKAYYWENQGWNLAENQKTEDGKIIVETPHLSTWTLLGNPASFVEKKAFCYPNPWVLHKHRKNGICFENLLKESFLDIYNISGERIFREIVPEDGKVVIYPNKLGLSSGVYLWVGEDWEGKKKIGKIGIIK
ncbi:MAG: hypothetical protein AB1630_09895, partial [bacterium]